MFFRVIPVSLNQMNNINNILKGVMVGYVFAQKLVFCLTLQAFLIDAPVLVDMKHGSVRYRKDQDAPTLKGREMPHEGSTDLEQKKHYFYHTRLNSFGAGDVYVLVSVSMFGGVYAVYYREKVRRPLNTVHKLSYIKVTDTVTAKIAWGGGGGGGRDIRVRVSRIWFDRNRLTMLFLLCVLVQDLECA